MYEYILEIPINHVVLCHLILCSMIICIKVLVSEIALIKMHRNLVVCHFQLIKNKITL